MIASIKLEGSNAVMQDDLTWHSDNAMLARLLNTQFSPDATGGVSPADGAPGSRQVELAAAALGAKIEWPQMPTETSGDDVVY